MTVHKSARKCWQPISVLQSVSCNFTLPNTDDRQTQHNSFPSASVQHTIDTNTALTHNRNLNLTSMFWRDSKLKSHQATGRRPPPETERPLASAVYVT